MNHQERFKSAASVLASSKSDEVSLQKRVLTLAMIGTNAIVVERTDRMQIFAEAGSISDQPVLCRVFISELSAVHVRVFVLHWIGLPILEVEIGI